MSSLNNNLQTSPSANDIAEALFAKLHSSGIQLVKDNNVMLTSEISTIPNPSSQSGHASTAQSMQIPVNTSIPPLATVQHDNSDDHDISLAILQPPLSSDPDVIAGEQFHSSSANVDTPYACHMLKHSIPLDFHVSYFVLKSLSVKKQEVKKQNKSWDFAKSRILHSEMLSLGGSRPLPEYLPAP
ncbi:unnamed protein product [Mytilus coruscus]|uniref:Uncharacterized protein n=1 Tax=Mytilus coruscus TaxID=42192 RepID=A0A6J8A0Y0_MYTCO|nr:unnamed protein product [Mytilus coruscus]